MVMIFAIFVFFAVSLVVGALGLWLVPTRGQARLAQVTQPEGGGTNWTETVVRLSGPLARLSMPDAQWEGSPLRLRFLNAGVRHPSARLVFFAAKTVFPLVFAGAAFLLVQLLNKSSLPVILMYVMSAALAGCYLPNLWLALVVRWRKREIFETFPDAADLMLVCVEAGLGLDASMSKVAEEMARKSRALAEELHLTNLEMRAGASREKALRNLASRTGLDETRTFATMLTQADKFGTSIAESLRVFSDDLRHKRQVRAEEMAAKVPTKMLFPLVLFIFPSVLMVVLGPALIQFVRTMAPMMAGQG
jgi:tight adherence protein C